MLGSLTPERAKLQRLPQSLGEALAALERSDITVLRCAEAGQPTPSDWVAYREALRAIVSGGPGPLPARPDWP